MSAQDTLRVLLELRPALEGHAGIPQETRLLFAALARLPGVQVQGLLQSGSLVLARGLPPEAADDRLPAHKRIDRLSRVVVSLQPGRGPTRFELLRAAWKLAQTLAGRQQALTRFDAARYADFVWRALFAKTLPPEDLETVAAAGYRIAQVPWSAMHATGVATAAFGHALYPRLDTRGFDVMIAETPYPGRVAAPTQLVVRYHDAMPLLMPHTVVNRAHHRAAHYQALRRNVADGAWFACVSEASRADLLAIFPQAEARATTIHNVVSPHYYLGDAPPERVPDVLRTRRNVAAGAGDAIAGAGAAGSALRYLLIVSTLEPRKNHLALLAAWEQLRHHGFEDLHLVCVGMLGWDHEPIVERFAPWMRRGLLHLLTDVPAGELRLLYQHALVTVCPSLGEGFDFSGVEAMRSGGVVVASELPVHREVFDDAAEYFAPYSVSSLAHALARVIGNAGAPRRLSLRDAGARVSARYLPERLLPQWQAFVARVRDEGATRLPAASAPAMQREGR